MKIIILFFITFFLFGCSIQNEMKKEEAEEIVTNFLYSLPKQDNSNRTVEILNSKQEGSNWEIEVKTTTNYVKGISLSNTGLVTLDSISKEIKCIETKSSKLCGDELKTRYNIS